MLFPVAAPTILMMASLELDGNLIRETAVLRAWVAFLMGTSVALPGTLGGSEKQHEMNEKREIKCEIQGRLEGGREGRSSYHMLGWSSVTE